MPRPTNTAVKELLLRNYDNIDEPSLTPFVDSSMLILARVITCATNKGITLSSAEQEMLARWLAAYLYTKADPMYSSRSTASASGAFVGNPEVPEWYKDGALMQDPSGCLNAILTRNRAGGFWAGRHKRDQTTWDDRNL